MVASHSPESGIGGGGGERIESTSFFNTTPADTACFNDAYSGLNRQGDAQQQGGGLGFGDMMRGAEETIDSIPDQMAKAGSSGLRMDSSQAEGERLWNSKDLAAAGKEGGELEVPKANFEGNRNAHSGMALLAAGMMDGRALGLNPDATRRQAQQIADGIVLDGNRRFS